MIENRAPQYLGVLYFFLPLCIIAVSLRCYCRLVLVKSFGHDDWFAVAGLALFILFCTFALNGVAHGTGRINSLISKKDFPIGMMWWWACEPTYILTNMALKQSIVIFLLRIAIDRTQRTILYATIIITQLYSVYFLFLFLFQCWPVSFFWNQYRGADGSCIDSNITVSSFYAYSAVCCVADWIFSITPIFMIKDLQMDRRTKTSVTIMLAFAAIASTATIIRIPYIRGLEDKANFLYSTLDVAIWSTCETGLGIMTSSVATLRPLLKKLKSTTRGDSSARSGSRWNQLNNFRPSQNRDGTVDNTDSRKKTLGITTIIEIGEQMDAAFDDHDTHTKRGLSRAGSVTALKDARGWNNSSELKTSDADSDEFTSSPLDFDLGIRKTVQVSQV